MMEMNLTRHDRDLLATLVAERLQTADAAMTAQLNEILQKLRDYLITCNSCENEVSNLEVRKCKQCSGFVCEDCQVMAKDEETGELSFCYCTSCFERHMVEM